MNKNRFSVDVGLNNDKADAPVEHNKKTPQEVLLTLALIFAAVMAVGIVSILFVSKRRFGSNNISKSNTPLVVAIVVTVVGGLMMALFMVLAMTAGIRDSKKRAAASPDNVQYTVDPTVLTDPRIKQLPEVQRLLQYESVQKAFFGGQFPSSSEELADPHLQELVTVLLQLADENGVIRL